MENKSPQNSSFMNGFLWGLLLGGAIVFLLGTKKGKRLLKILTEEGIEGMAELGELINEFGNGDEEEILEKKSKIDNESKTLIQDEPRVHPRRFFKRSTTKN